MKIKLLAPSLLLILSFSLFFSCKKDDPSHPNPPTDSTNVADLKKGLLLYLPFNGSIADSSGNNNPTTGTNGASLTSDEHGYANSAFGSNGGGQTIEVTNNGSIHFDTAYTISLSFMTRDNSSRHTYLSMVNPANGDAPSFEVGTPLPGLPNFDVGVNDISAGCDNNGLSNPNKLNDTTSLIPESERWYNAIVIYHRGSVQIYINGKLISSKKGTGTSANLCPASKIIVGGWWYGDNTNINGVIDNVRLYNRVLLPEETTLLAKNYQPNSNSIRQVVSH